MIERNKIVKFCEDYLKVKNFTDYCHNGLQVEGAEKIAKIVTGVSLSEALIREAIKTRAEMIIVHHGLFSKSLSQPPEINGYVKNRLKLLLENNINLCGFHLPLDAHPVIGNNISLAKLLGLINPRLFDDKQYGEIGFIGELKQSLEFKKFVKLVNDKLETKSYAIAAGKKIVKKAVIVSGGASSDFKIAAELGADVFLCGDISESVVEAVKETKINFINAGHYNTEKLGIINLGKLVEKKFKIKVEFIDIPCEI